MHDFIQKYSLVIVLFAFCVLTVLVNEWSNHPADPVAQEVVQNPVQVLDKVDTNNDQILDKVLEYHESVLEEVKCGYGKGYAYNIELFNNGKLKCAEDMITIICDLDYK